MASSITLKYRAFGLYDKVLRTRLIQQFLEGNYKHPEYGQDWREKVKKLKSLMEFDEFVRTKILGYRSVHSLYRETSCDRFVGKINKPFLVLTSKDDPITPLDMLPIADLYGNPNCFMLYTRFGGHPDFLTIENGREKRYQPELTMLFFEEVRTHLRDSQSGIIGAKESLL